MNTCSNNEPGKTKRGEQKAERNALIISTALDLFIRRGYSGTRIADIAEAAGMSVGLLFHYYPSKEKLYEALYRIGLSGLRDVEQFDTSDPLAFFEKSATYIFEQLRKNPFVAKMFVFMAHAEHNEAAPEAVKELMHSVSFVDKTAPLISRGQEAGLFRDGNPQALSLAFWCCIQGIAEEIAIHPELEYPDPAWILDIIRK